MKKKHPWHEFLKARAKVIDWLNEDNKNDEEIAQELSMDATQVRLIRQRDRSGEPND